MILNIILVIITILFWSIKSTIVENPNIFNICFISPIIIIAEITIISYTDSIVFGYSGIFNGRNFNNYFTNREYLRCKFAILNNRQNENNNLDKFRKYFQINLYKFIDDEKIKISEEIKIKSKKYSNLTKWFIMIGLIIIDVIFQLGAVIATILTILYFLNKILIFRSTNIILCVLKSYI